jgi:hypothetical protein
MPEPHDTHDPVGPENLGQSLDNVVRENWDKVVGWIKGEPGCWGFLAGKAVNHCRAKAGRSLSDGERRIVWNRLWAFLEQIKAQVGQKL